MFVWCFVTELSLSSKSWKDDDLLLQVILKDLSCLAVREVQQCLASFGY